MSNVSQRSSAPERRARRPVPIAAFLFVVVALAAAIQHTTAAENIFAGQTCSDKVYWNKSHLCGYAPGTGTLRFTNTGVHEVAIFTLPAFVDTSNWNGDITGPFGIDAFGELNIVWDIPVGGSTTIQVNATDEVYIGRSDGTRSNRTITVRFDVVPGPLLGGPPPDGAGPLPEQRIEAVLDALTCPQQDQPGMLDTLGIAIAIDDTTQFEAESCADLAGLVASGMSFLVEVRIREDETGALAAAAVALVPDSGGRGHGHGRGGSRQRQ